MGMVLYSLLLGVGLLAAAPVWGWRMLRKRRYRAGLRQRLGAVPAVLRAGMQGKRVVWVHAVSVGEVLAAEALVRELGASLGNDWRVVISTTTETGQRIAQQRFGAERVFYWPLDFGWIVRRYLRALRPELLVLVESELWPRMLDACRRGGIPVAVVNARMSDRSFRRAQRVNGLWRWMAAGVTVFLAQGEETAGRLRTLGAREVRVLGNLKFDLQPGEANVLAERLRRLVAGRKLVVAGSTLPGEEAILLEAWPDVLAAEPEAALLLAPRHAPRFAEVEELILRHGKCVSRASGWAAGNVPGPEAVLLLDTLGDLASVYGVAAVAFVGGSLVQKGGHNPLEAARFGVPVVMGPHFENFREIVDGMLAEDAIAIVPSQKLAWGLQYLLAGHDGLSDDGVGMGGRGKLFFEAQAGATGRTVGALRAMIGE